jgi:hypothetical protein
LRIVVQQRDNSGSIRRSWPGAPPDGTPLGKVLVISASQSRRPLPVEINYDKVIWSGLSWAVGEIAHHAMQPDELISIRCSSTEREPITLEVSLYALDYRQ